MGEFHSVRQMREICKVFKGMFQEQAEQVCAASASSSASDAASSSFSPLPPPALSVFRSATPQPHWYVPDLPVTHASQTRRLVTAASTMGDLGGTMGATDVAGLTGLGAAEGAGDDSKLVGDADEAGFGLGLAADTARPMTTEAGALRSTAEAKAEAKGGEPGASMAGVSFDSPMAEAKGSGSGGFGATAASSPGMVDMSDRDQAFQVCGRRGERSELPLPTPRRPTPPRPTLPIQPPAHHPSPPPHPPPVPNPSPRPFQRQP